MMDGNPVERFDPREFGKLVNQARRKKDFRSAAGRAVRADKLEPFAGGDDVRYPRPAHRDGLVAGEFFPRLIQKSRQENALPFREGRELRASSDCADALHRRAVLCGGTFPG